MYLKIHWIAILLTLPFLSQTQDTFSIVAVDPVTGEIGSAGATCLDDNTFPGSGGALIISDVIPGRGAIHTQAAYNATNQNRAHDRMIAGDSPEEIISYMMFNDANLFSPTTRQYGVVDLDPQGNPRSAGFTGVDCFDYKNHITGPNYAIQGNILLNPSDYDVLGNMEANFLNTPGTLADKMMAALQGANVVGADTRCAPNGTSSLSAFLRIAKPNDNPDALYLDLIVPALPAGQEPIDSVQTLYDEWLLTDTEAPSESVQVSIFPNPTKEQINITISAANSIAHIYNLQGKLVHSASLEQGKNTITPNWNTGAYVVRVYVEKLGTTVVRRVIVE